MEETMHTPEQKPSSDSGENLSPQPEVQSCQPPVETQIGAAAEEQKTSVATDSSIEQASTASLEEKAHSKVTEDAAASSTHKINPEMLRHQQNAARSKSHASYLNDDKSYWFLLRDLRRANSLEHGYQLLEKSGMRVFTPLEWRIKKTPSKKVRVLVPVMPDLLFVFGTYKEVAQQVSLIPRIQFRYLKGKGFMEPTTIPTEEMEYFIKAMSSSDEPKFYLPGEITESDIGRKVMIIGGPLNGYTGRLLKWKGSKKKALIIEIKNYLVGTVTLEPELIQYVDDGK